MNRINRILVLLALAHYCAPMLAASEPGPWDGLIEVKARQMDTVQLLPGADFRQYAKVMVDPAQVAFHKDWMRNINRSLPGLSRDVTDEDAARIAAAARSDFQDVFTAAFRARGYEVVPAAGPGVLRLSPTIMNLYINAPDAMSAGLTRTYTMEAGEATLVLEARDATTGALLGRALDRRETRSSASLQLSSSVINLADFRALFRRWADICVKGLDELKSHPPAAEASGGAGAEPSTSPPVAAQPTPEDLFGRSATASEGMVREATGIEQIQSLEGTIASTALTASGKRVVTLSNGQVWTQTDTDTVRLAPGDAVIIRRAALGSYLLAPRSGGRSIRVKRSR